MFIDISLVVGLYCFICGGELNYNVNYSYGKEISCFYKLKNDLDRLFDVNCDIIWLYKNFVKIVII